MEIGLQTLVIGVIFFLPSYYTVAWFRYHGLPVKASLGRTLTVNLLLFGSVFGLSSYVAVFSWVDNVNFWTPLRLVLEGAGDSNLFSRLNDWIVPIVLFQLMAVFWSGAVVGLLDAAVRDKKALFVIDFLEALDVWDPLSLTLRRSINGEINARPGVDVLIKNQPLIYSGVLTEIIPASSETGGGVVIDKARKRPYENGEAGRRISVGKATLNPLFIPWASILNVHLVQPLGAGLQAGILERYRVKKTRPANQDESGGPPDGTRG